MERVEPASTRKNRKRRCLLSAFSPTAIGRRQSVDVRIGEESEEFGEFRASHHLLEYFGGVVEAAWAELGFELGKLLRRGGAHHFGGDGLAIVEFCAVL